MTDPAVPSAELMARALRELQRAQQRIEQVEAAQRQPIAIVGAACRLPGGIDCPAALWQFLRGGGDAVTDIPPDRWDVDRFFNAEPGHPGRISARLGAFLDDVRGFDANFFGIAPREAELMDPQQRLLLEACWHAIEDAGLACDRLRDRSVGTFVGISTTDYAYHLVQQVPSDEVSAYCGTGTSHAVAAGRIAYALDLTGPCLSLDTACSSSLVALHLACASLRAGECDFAVVAGVNVMTSPLTAESFSHARMLSPRGRCRTFDAGADGYARGEGVVALLLARSRDLADEDLTPYAEVLGSAVNQDGRSAGLTVPNGPAQVRVVRRALAAAGVAPADVDYVEAHGTGTALGDPIELAALGQVFAEAGGRAQPVLVASVKTNLGHTEATAGLLSVLKTALQLQHGEIAPHLHLATPNPHVAWAELPVSIPAALRPWPKGPRRVAGVSSFGFSGTNAHVVLAGAAATQPAPRSNQHLRAEVAIPLAAPDEHGLRALARAWSAAVAVASPQELLDLAYTAAAGRALHRVRAVAIAADPEALARALLEVQPGQVLDHDGTDHELEAQARAFTAGERPDLGARLLRLGARRVSGGAAPRYPFQHRDYWYGARRGGHAPQRLVARAVELPAPLTRPPAGDWLVLATTRTADLAAELTAALIERGAEARFATAIAPADVFVAVLATTDDVQQWLADLPTLLTVAPQPQLCVVVAGDAATAQAAAAALRSLALERPMLRARCVDVTEHAVPADVAAELLAIDAPDEVSLHGPPGAPAVRRATTFIRAPGGELAPTFAADHAYLVTGGTGALGRALAGWLRARGAGRVVLAARRGAALTGEGLDGCVGIDLDVTDAAAVQAAVAAIPDLAGVFHLAGAVDDAPVTALDTARLAAQFAVKLAGARHLDAATADRELDWFVCFTSAAAWLGNPGQVAYAAANGALEGFLADRSRSGRPGHAVAFGPWRVGMAADADVLRRLRSAGIHALTSTAALAALEVTLGAARGPGPAATAIVDVDWRAHQQARGGLLPARLTAFSVAPPSGPAAPLAPADLDDVDAGKALARLTPWLCATVAAVLGHPPDRVAPDSALLALGLDSLSATDLHQRLQQTLRVDIGLPDVLDAADPEALARRLLHLRRTGPASGPDGGPDAGPTDGDADEDLVELVDRLSDDEVRRMLGDREPR